MEKENMLSGPRVLISFREIGRFARSLEIGDKIQKVNFDFGMGENVITTYRVVKKYKAGVLLKARCYESPSYVQLMTQPEWRIRGKQYWQLVGRTPNNPDTKYR